MKTIASRRTLSRTIAALLFGGAILSAPAVQAQSWSGATNGDWLTTTNWTGGVAAGSTTSTDTDIAVFNVNANNTIGINMTTAGGNYYLGAIDNTNATARIINNTSGTTGVLTLNGATVNSVANTILRNSQTQLLTIGNSGSGTLGLALGNATTNVIQITGNGGITISSNITGSNGITKQGTGAGVLTLSGNNNYTGVTAINAGVVTISNANALGATGAGNNTTIAANGSATGGRLQVAGISSAEAITLTGTTEVTGFGGAIVSTSGTSTLSGNITLAGSGGLKILANSGTTLTLSGTISQTTTTHGLVLQSFGGTGVLNVSNPLAINGGSLLIVGSNGTAGGLVTLSGASGTGVGATTIGQRATLRLGVTDALNTSANLLISYGGSNAGEDMATFDLRGFNQTINALNGTVGGSNSSANSNRLVTNGAASGTSILTVGNGGGSGTFNGQINNGATASIQLIKTGAGNQTLNDQNSYTGGTRIDGGTLTLGHATNTLADTGAVDVNGGTLALGTRTDTVGAVTLTGGSITGTGAGALTGTSYDVRSGSVTAILAGSSVALTKSTAGTVTLTGPNTYTGVTTVSAGSLLVNNTTGSGTGTAQVTVNGGTLGGNGIISGAVTVNTGGTLAAGNSIDSLATGALTLNTSSTFAYEIDNDAASAMAGDLTAVTGNLTLDLGNAAILTLAELGSGSWTPGEKLTLISYSGTWNGGLFNYGGTLADDSTVTFSGMDWLFNYNDTVAGSNYTGDLTGSSFVTMTAIPEPSTLVLGGLALLGFAGVGLRKRQLAK